MYKKGELSMKIANEGKKNLEPKANYIEPRGCGCNPGSLLSSARDYGCACGCTTSSNSSSAKNVGVNL